MAKYRVWLFIPFVEFWLKLLFPFRVFVYLVWFVWFNQFSVKNCKMRVRPRRLPLTSINPSRPLLLPSPVWIHPWPRKKAKWAEMLDLRSTQTQVVHQVSSVRMGLLAMDPLVVKFVRSQPPIGPLTMARVTTNHPQHLRRSPWEM